MQRFGGWVAAASVAAAVMVFLGAGCAQDVGDIDRTQADKIDKEIFQNNDEWYYRQTVIDTQMEGSSLISKSTESDLKRIRWKITEDILYAHSTVPLADGLEDDQTSEEDRRLGPVAAFPITDHFDIQRAYNESTGEQSNVIVENREDRPWYDRDYMRVDWSTNLVDGKSMFGSALGEFSAATYDPPIDDNRVDPDRARITEDYIDVTTEYVFQPDLNACAFNIGTLDRYTRGACEGNRIRTRSSFVRIDEERENSYEPFEMVDERTITDENGDPLYTTTITDNESQRYLELECTPETRQYLREEYGNDAEQCQPATFEMFDRFGYFRTERIAWNERYGNTDSDRRYYANRWNIWQTAYNEDGERIPLAERDPKPIVYHLNAEYPKDMIPAAKDVEHQWNQAFLESVRVAKGYDSVEDVEDELEELYDDPRMFKIVENSCMPGPLVEWKKEYGTAREADRANVNDLFVEFAGTDSNRELVSALWNMPKQERVQLCAELEWATETRADDAARYSWEQLGDLRYSFFNWVDELNGSWSGYGPSAADPLTGEIVSANANYSGTPLRRTATYYTDVIQYINGELSENDIRYGEHVRDYVQELKERRREQALSPELTPEANKELARRAGQNPNSISPTDFEEPPAFEEQDEFIKKWGRERIEQEADRLSETITEAKRSDTRITEFYENPRVKEFLMSDADFQMAVRATAHEMFGSEVGEDEMHQAYLDLANPMEVARRTNRAERFHSERNVFTARSLERAMSSLVTYDGVAEAFKGKDREEIRRYLMDNAFIGTQLHEIGHTVGLRHNFAASTDALNYHDGFWEIQKALLEGTLQDGDGVTVTERGAVHITDPNLAEQFTNRQDPDYVSTAELRLGSIMDYTGDLTGRFAGLGKYDQAAINFAYGESVEQWSDDVDLPNRLWYEEWTRDYRELPSIYGNDPHSSDPQVRMQGIDVMLNGREWVALDSAIEQRLEDIENNTEMFVDGSLDFENEPIEDRTVPYEFCSDEFRNSRLGCDVFDWGANQTEVVNHAFDQYRFFQPFWRYKGHDNNRLDTLASSYQNRLISTFQMAERPFRYYSIYQWWDLGSYTDDLKRAAMDSLNFYAEVLAMPEPNVYCEYETGIGDRNEGWYYNLNGNYIPNSMLRDRTSCDNAIEIHRGEGQHYSYDFTDEYYYRIRRVGSYIDKLTATSFLFNISANYAYSSFFTDFRASNISYWTLFEDELNEFLRGIIIGDYTGFGGVYDRDEQRYIPPKVVDLEAFGRGLDNPQDGMQRVFSRVNLTEQFNTLGLAMLTNSTFEDRSTDFSNYVKVAVTYDELQPLADWVDINTLEHPTTGQVYHAPQTADGKSISYELIEWAKELKYQWQQAEAELENYPEGTDEYEDYWEDVQIYQEQFEDVIAKLEMIRYFFDLGINR